MQVDENCCFVLVLLRFNTYNLILSFLGTYFRVVPLVWFWLSKTNSNFESQLVVELLRESDNFIVFCGIQRNYLLSSDHIIVSTLSIDESNSFRFDLFQTDDIIQLSTLHVEVLLLEQLWHHATVKCTKTCKDVMLLASYVVRSEDF